jgi:hypothetical protein
MSSGYTVGTNVGTSEEVEIQPDLRTIGDSGFKLSYGIPALKNIDPEDILVSSFEMNKTFTLSESDSGSGLYVVPIVKGTISNLYNFNIDDADSKTISSSIFYKVPVYHTINSLYYRDINQMNGFIDLIRGVPTSSDAILSYTYTHPSETNPSMKYNLRIPFTRQLHNTATVIGLPQKYFGERIKPYSVRITDNSTDATFILQDDGYGNLYDVEYSSSYAMKAPDANNSGSLVGNVFYDDGIIVITDTGSYSTVGTLEGSDGFILKFDSSQTIYEREYVCKVPENEYTHTTNRSLKIGQSGSVIMAPYVWTSSLDAKTVFDEFPYDLVGYATSSYKTKFDIGSELIGEATHSDFATYVTTIGLYNDKNELLAIGKTAKPIKNDKELALSFVVRFDTN